MPRVSVGVPVYNGERYLAETLESLVTQTYEDIEILICDNASTDGTERISREYAARDSRIRYHRNDRNLGAAGNFDRSFELATGEFFKWAAGDDLCAPTFLERCVERLDADPGAVMAYPRTIMVDEDSREIDRYTVKLPTDQENPVGRFNSLLKGHMCFEIFGLIRSDALASTPGMGAYSHGDGVLLARLALLGRLEEIPEFLFLSRRHREQSMSMVTDRRQYAAWFNPQLGSRLTFPIWRTWYEFGRSVHRPPLSADARLRCYVCVVRQAWRRRSALWADVRDPLLALFRRDRSGAVGPPAT